MSDNVMMVDNRAEGLRLAGQMVVVFGTTANALAWELARFDPRIRAFIVGLDGEWARSSGQDSFTISNGSEADWQRARAWRTHPLLKYDPLLPKLDIPAQIGAGAGRHRVIGNLRYFVKRGPFVTQVKDTARAALSAMGNVGGQGTIFRVHFVSTTVGGSGAGILPIGAVDTISAIRALIPGAHIWATAHLLGPTCFEGLSTEKELKMLRNTDGILRELHYLQNAQNLRDFAEKIEVFWDESRGHLLDEIHDYSGTDSRNVAFTLRESFARVGQNIRAAFDPTVTSIRVEREGCNRAGRVDLTPRHVVTSAQAKLAVVPLVLPTLFASRWLYRELEPLLAKADVSQLSGEVGESYEALNIEGVFNRATSGAYRQLGVSLLNECKSLAEQGGDEETVTISLDRQLDRQKTLVVEHFAARVGKYVSRWAKELAKRYGSVGALRTVLKHVAHRLDEAASRARAQTQALEKEVADGPTKKRGWFRNYSGMADYLDARIMASRFETAGEIIVKFSQGVKAWVEKLDALGESLRLMSLDARKSVAESEETIRGDSGSVVRPGEIVGLHASVKAFITERGEALPTVSLAGLLELDVATGIQEIRKSVAGMVRRQISGESVSSFATAMKLSFDTERWLRETLRTLGGTSPLVPSLVPEVEVEKTIVVAAGIDFKVVDRLLQENPRLAHHLELVKGTEPGSVFVVRGFDNAPIEAMATFAAAARAAIAFRRRNPDAGKTQPIPLDAVQVSCSALLGAFDADSPGEETHLLTKATSVGPHNGRAVAIGSGVS